MCQDFCKNNGICNDGLNNEYDFEWNSTLVANLSCTCRSDRFAGKTCEFDKCSKKVNSSMSSCYLDSSCNYLCNEECDRAYCKSNGVCYSDSGNLACKCNIGFLGPTCNINQCTGYCFNNGTCSVNSTISCQCQDSFTGSRCSLLKEKTTSQSKGRSTFRSIIYAFTFTLAICLVSMGIYYLVQNGYFRNINMMNPLSKANVLGSNRTAGGAGSFFRTNFSFNKLEDEQIITQNEHVTDSV